MNTIWKIGKETLPVPIPSCSRPRKKKILSSNLSYSQKHEAHMLSFLIDDYIIKL